MKSLLQKGIAVAGIAGLGFVAQGCDDVAPAETTATDVAPCGPQYELAPFQIQTLSAQECAKIMDFKNEDLLLRDPNGNYPATMPAAQINQQVIDCALTALVNACEQTR